VRKNSNAGGKLNRRHFLKYAGASAAVVAASALGLDYLDTMSTPVGQVTTSSSTEVRSITSSSATMSSSPVEIASLEERLFFDYNGNGNQEPGEPAIPNASISLDGLVRFEALTNSTGDYKIEGIPAGSNKVYVQADQRFRYMCTSTEEFRATGEKYDLVLKESRKLDVGLMEGFPTLPFKKYESRLESYVDLDPSSRVRDWKGGIQTYDGHPRTDFLASAGTEVLATAPGRVFAAAGDWPNYAQWIGRRFQGYYRNNGNFVIIDCGNNLFVAYHHLQSINVPETFPETSNGPIVQRGQVIGLAGATGFTSAGGNERIKVEHLHFQVWNGTGFMHGRVDALDPFRDLFYGRHGASLWSNPVSLWTKDNDPQYAAA